MAFNFDLSRPIYKKPTAIITQDDIDALRGELASMGPVTAPDVVPDYVPPEPENPVDRIRYGGDIAPDLLQESGAFSDAPVSEYDIRRHGGDIAPDLLQTEGIPAPHRPANPPFGTITGGPTPALNAGPLREQLRDYLLTAGVPPLLANQYETVSTTLAPLTDDEFRDNKAIGLHYGSSESAPNRIRLSTNNGDFAGAARHEAAHAYDDQGSITGSREFQLAARRAIEEDPKAGYLKTSFNKGDWPHVFTAVIENAPTLADVPYALRDYFAPIYNSKPTARPAATRQPPQFPPSLLTPEEQAGAQTDLEAGGAPEAIGSLGPSPLPGDYLSPPPPAGTRSPLAEGVSEALGRAITGAQGVQNVMDWLGRPAGGLTGLGVRRAASPELLNMVDPTPGLTPSVTKLYNMAAEALDRANLVEDEGQRGVLLQRAQQLSDRANQLRQEALRERNRNVGPEAVQTAQERAVTPGEENPLSALGEVSRHAYEKQSVPLATGIGAAVGNPVNLLGGPEIALARAAARTAPGLAAGLRAGLGATGREVVEAGERAFSGTQPWEVLGIARNATRETAEAAYRDLSKLVHPDITGGSSVPQAALNRAVSYFRNPELYGNEVELAAQITKDPQPWDAPGYMTGFQFGQTVRRFARDESGQLQLGGPSRANNLADIRQVLDDVDSNPVMQAAREALGVKVADNLLRQAFTRSRSGQAALDALAAFTPPDYGGPHAAKREDIIAEAKGDLEELAKAQVRARWLMREDRQRYSQDYGDQPRMDFQTDEAAASPARQLARTSTETVIGQNAFGDPVYEDQRGVRGYVSQGVRLTEPTVPDTTGRSRPAPDRLPAFRTVEEAAQSNGVDIPVQQKPTRADVFRAVYTEELARHAAGTPYTDSKQAAALIDSVMKGVTKPVSEPINYNWYTPAGKATLARLGIQPSYGAIRDWMENPAPAQVPEPAGGTIEGGTAHGGVSTSQPEVVGGRSGAGLQTPPAEGVPAGEAGGAYPGVSQAGGRELPPVRGEYDRAGDVAQPGVADRHPGVSGENPRRLDTDQPGARGSDLIIDPQELAVYATASPAVRFDANLDAVRTVKQLIAEDRLLQATPEEKAILAKFSGWGDSQFNQAFSRHLFDDPWSQRGKALKELLTSEEYASAQASRKNAFFTPSEIIQALWTAARNMGLDGLAEPRILEPSAGIGRFLGMQPAETAVRSQRTAVELDTVTGSMLKALYPNTDVYVTGFERAPISDNSLDLAISNVPFGKYAVFDPSIPKVVASRIHNYFFAKALEKLRPGGVLAFVTSHYTLDAVGMQAVRKYLGDRADFLGAIRLPRAAFPDTEVVADLIFMQKRAPGATPRDVAWTGAENAPLPTGRSWNPTHMLPVNEYFIEHPEMVLGEPSATGTMRREMEYTVERREGDDMVALLNQAIARLPATTIPELAGDTAVSVPAPKGHAVSEGSYAVATDGQLMVNKDGVLARSGLLPADAAVVQAMLGVRDAGKALLDLQLHGGSDTEIAAAQQKLNTLYDAFVGKHGALNARRNVSLMKEDTASGPFLRSLEQLPKDEALLTLVLSGKPLSAAQRTILKMAIFRERVVAGEPTRTAASPADALLASLNDRGYPDFAHMAALLGQSATEVQNALATEGLIFRNPTGGWETADVYLSGDVRRKLEEAETAFAVNSAFRYNVEMLRTVQPRDLAPSEIGVRLGATWIPSDDVNEFIGQLLGSRRDYDKYPEFFRYSEPTGHWVRQLTITGNQAKLTTEWGTPDLPADKIIERLLTSKPIEIKRKDDESHLVTDAQATEAAKQKALAIQEEFARWLWEDPDRAGRLAAYYNRHLNNLRPWTPDGSHLTLAGITPEWAAKMRPLQKDAIWRIVQQRTVGLFHEVGFGKTASMVAASMEMRRLGFVRKPLHVVPKQTYPGYVNAFKELYPHANVLFPDEKAFAPETRVEMMHRIATGDWDAVVITDSQMKQLPLRPETQTAFLRQQIADYKASLEEMVDRGESKRSMKDIEAAVSQMETRLNNLQHAIEQKQDVGVTFEDLGIDQLFVDEAHNYKNLRFNTAMGRVKGLGSAANGEGSQQAWDMYQKMRLLQGNEKGVVFATGTPIDNTIAELWTMMRYLQPRALEERGMQHFDAWARTFGVVESDIEQTVQGTYRPTERFSRFINAAELNRLWQETADIRVSAETGEVGKLKPWVIEEEGPGQRTVVRAEADDAYSAYMQVIIQRADAMSSQDPKDDNFLKLASDAAKASLDMRLIDPLAPFNPNGKIAKTTAEVVQFYRAESANKGTQLVFMDLGTPKATDRADALEAVTDEGAETAQEAQDTLSVFGWLRQSLVDAGIPREEIAFINEAKTDKQKSALEAKINSGTIRVLIGSNKKMGIGLNLQERLGQAVFVTVGWKPAEVEQSEGRPLRPGNKVYGPVLGPGDEVIDKGRGVRILRVVQQGSGNATSFDGFKWQAIEKKAQSIREIYRRDVTARTVEDVAQDSLGAGTAKAIASGNPYQLELTKTQMELRRLEMEQASFAAEQSTARYKVVQLPKDIAVATRNIAGFQADLGRVEQAGKTFSIIVNGTPYYDRGAAGEPLLKAVRTAPESGAPMEIGNYKGFTLSAARATDVHYKGNYRLLLRNDANGDVHASDYITPFDVSEQGLLRRLDNALGRIGQKLQIAQTQKSKAETELASYQQLVQRQYRHQPQLDAYRNRVTQLERKLQGQGLEEPDIEIPPETTAAPETAVAPSAPTSEVPAKPSVSEVEAIEPASPLTPSESPPEVHPASTLRTVSGREIPGAPPIRTGSDRIIRNDLLKVDRWLVNQAREEAEATQNEHMLTLIDGIAPAKMTPAERDNLNHYLFGKQDAYEESPSSALAPSPVPPTEVSTQPETNAPPEGTPQTATNPEIAPEAAPRPTPMVEAPATVSPAAATQQPEPIPPAEVPPAEIAPPPASTGGAAPPPQPPKPPTTEAVPEGAPEEPAPKRKERRFTKRLRTVEGLVSDPIREALEDNLQSYEELGNRVAHIEAATRIAADPAAARARVLDMEREADPISFAEGIQLLTKADAEGNRDEALTLAFALAAKGTARGQEIQLLSTMGRVSREGVLLQLAKALQGYTKEHGNTAALQKQIQKETDAAIAQAAQREAQKIIDEARKQLAESQRTKVALQDEIDRLVGVKPGFVRTSRLVSELKDFFSDETGAGRVDPFAGDQMPEAEAAQWRSRAEAIKALPPGPTRDAERIKFLSDLNALTKPKPAPKKLQEPREVAERDRTAQRERDLAYLTDDTVRDVQPRIITASREAITKVKAIYKQFGIEMTDEVADSFLDAAAELDDLPEEARRDAIINLVESERERLSEGRPARPFQPTPQWLESRAVEIEKLTSPEARQAFARLSSIERLAMARIMAPLRRTGAAFTQQEAEQFSIEARSLRDLRTQPLPVQTAALDALVEHWKQTEPLRTALAEERAQLDADAAARQRARQTASDLARLTQPQKPGTIAPSMNAAERSAINGAVALLRKAGVTLTVEEGEEIQKAAYNLNGLTGAAMTQGVANLVNKVRQHDPVRRALELQAQQKAEASRLKQRMQDIEVLSGRLMPEARIRARNVEREIISRLKAAVVSNELGLPDVLIDNLLERANMAAEAGPGLQQDRLYNALMQDIKNLLPPSRWEQVKSLLDIPRGSQTAWDVSYPFRQGWRTAVRHPVLWASLWEPMLQAFRDPELARALMDELATDPMANLAHWSGVDFVEYGDPLTTGDEHFGNALLGKIPLYLRSEIAYVLPGNIQRRGLFTDMVRGWFPDGTDFRAFTSLEEAAAAAGKPVEWFIHAGKFANTMTGRGSVEWLRSQMPILQQLLYAARWTVSKVEPIVRMAAPPIPGAAWSQTPLEIRRAYAENLLSLYGLVGSIIATGVLAGVWESDADPRSTNFGKVRFKGTSTWVDLMGGAGPVFRFLAQTVPTRRDDGTWGGTRKDASGHYVPYGASDAIVKFARSIMSPVPGTIADFIAGHDPVGRRRDITQPGDIADAVFRMLGPLSWHDIGEAAWEVGLKDGVLPVADIALNATQLGGLSAQTYSTFRDVQNKVASEGNYYREGRRITRYEDLNDRQRKEVNDSAAVKAELERIEQTTQRDPKDVVESGFRIYDAAKGRHEQVLRGLIEAGVKGKDLKTAIQKFKEANWNSSQDVFTLPEMVEYLRHTKATETPEDALANEYWSVEPSQSVDDNGDLHLDFNYQRREREKVLQRADAMGIARSYITEKRSTIADPVVKRVVEGYDHDMDLIHDYYEIKDLVAQQFPVSPNALTEAYRKPLRTAEEKKLKEQWRQSHPEGDQALRTWMELKALKGAGTSTSVPPPVATPTAPRQPVGAGFRRGY